MALLSKQECPICHGAGKTHKINISYCFPWFTYFLTLGITYFIYRLHKHRNNKCCELCNGSGIYYTTDDNYAYIKAIPIRVDYNKYEFHYDDVKYPFKFSPSDKYYKLIHWGGNKILKSEDRFCKVVHSIDGPIKLEYHDEAQFFLWGQPVSPFEWAVTLDKTNEELALILLQN